MEFDSKVNDVLNKADESGDGDLLDPDSDDGDDLDAFTLDDPAEPGEGSSTDAVEPVEEETSEEGL